MNSSKTRSESTAEILNFIHTTFSVQFAEEKVSMFLQLWRRKWESVQRNQKAMDTNYADWLNLSVIPNTSLTTKQPTSDSNSKKRSTQPFNSISESQKRRRTAELRKEDSSALLFATSSKLRKDGNLTASNIVQQSESESSESVPESFTQTEVVALITEMKLTKEQYQVLRKWSKKKRHQKCFRHMDVRLSTRKKMLPKKYASSGFSHFKQALNDANANDSTMFITAIVPVVIQNYSTNIVWENPAPNSIRLCRPLRLKYEKETNEAVETEYKRMQAEITKLKEYSIINENGSLNIKHVLVLTMK